MPDAQDRAELTDDDQLGGEYPPERPLGAHRRQDDAIPETFAGREARTRPDVDADRTADGGVEDPVELEDRITSEDVDPEVPEAAEEAALHLQDLDAEADAADDALRSTDR